MQTHRGPDADGWFAGRRAVIAQNRLSIIDLVTGNPPMTDEERRIGAVLNGEIYNYMELREELRRAGHTLSSQGDTETLAHLAECLDAVAIARKLDGMFAFAIWDERRERLILGRDRLGKKPLYYWCDGRAMVFASEIKGVLAHPAVPRRLNHGAIPAYLTFGYVPSPHTFYEGVKSLAPGHVLTFVPGTDPKIERYWTAPVPGVSDGVDTLDIRIDEAASEVRRLLQASVTRRLVADVPLGAFLSGGIDSSAVVAMMAEVRGEPVKTFTIGFEDTDGFDERPFARSVAARFGTEHHEEVVHPHAVELVEQLLFHYDQPFGDSSAIPTYLLGRLARQDVAVALSGDGGDELFAGYERFLAGAHVAAVLNIPAPFRALMKATLARLDPRWAGGRVGRLQRFASHAELGMPHAYIQWIRLVSEAWAHELLLERNAWAEEEFVGRWDKMAPAKTLDRMLAVNLDTYLVDDLLVKADRMSMAHGLEVRSPFLDTALVDFAMRLPPSLKLGGASLKRVLKAAVRDLLPPDVLDRRKRGFGVPLDRWFRDDLKGYALDMLGERARVRRHLRPTALDRLLTEHVRGNGQHGHALWAILTLELFLRKNEW